MSREKSTKRWFNILYLCFAFLVVVGSILKFSHYQYGREMVLIGIMLGIVLLIAENIVLKKRNKKLKARLMDLD